MTTKDDRIAVIAATIFIGGVLLATVAELLHWKQAAVAMVFYILILGLAFGRQGNSDNTTGDKNA